MDNILDVLQEQKSDIPPDEMLTVQVDFHNHLHDL